jgi:hypothetical protein
VNYCPPTINEARVVTWAKVDDTVRPTGNTVHRFNGPVLGPVPCLAICQYAEDEGYYLFYCSEDWEPLTDTWHQTLEDAKSQAQFEYEGIDSRWQDFAQPQ